MAFPADCPPTDAIDADGTVYLLPKLGQWIAQATLTGNHGKTMLTAGQQPTHTTFWTYEGLCSKTPG